MKQAKKRKRNIRWLLSILAGPAGIWPARSVSSEPQKWLHSWQIYKVVKAKAHPEVFGYHFVGYDVRGGHGAVSSKIEQFDPVKMCGVTQSGRVYQLIGMPGENPDGQYTLVGWIRANELTMEDATEEFIQHYGINLEHVRAMEMRGRT